jgi:hypothetical protein
VIHRRSFFEFFRSRRHWKFDIFLGWRGFGVEVKSSGVFWVVWSFDVWASWRKTVWE